MSEYRPLRLLLSTEHVILLTDAIREGLVDDDPECLDELAEFGLQLVNLTAPPTGYSRTRITVQLIARDQGVVDQPWHTLVQSLGLAAIRRYCQVPAGPNWYSQARITTHYDHARSQAVRMVVPDGRYDERQPDWTTVTHTLEWSSGRMSRKRIEEKIRCYGWRSQWWGTSSEAHAAMIREVLTEVYPSATDHRVMVVPWWGETVI